MKKFFLLPALLLAFTACLNNTDKNAGGAGAATASNVSPKIGGRDTASLTTLEWLDSAKHLGTIKQGEVLKIDYRFRNTGNRPLIIESVRPGCGCTVADYPKQPIAPGQEGVIKAEFDSHNKEGFQSKSIAVDANTRDSYTLWFDVNITKGS